VFKFETVKHKTKTMEHKFGFGLYGLIKAIKIGLYGGDRVVNYFIFISVLKFRKTIFKL